jgi:hypothetical protein
MKIFEITDTFRIVCEYKSTGYGFKHTATLFIDGVDRESVKCTYQNRTWESYEFQSVLYKLAEKSKVLSKEEKQFLHDYAKTYQEHDSGLSAIAGVMSLASLFTDNESASNDWKERMLRAGLEGRGLIMPDDWESLPEAEKTKRLDGVIGALK